MLTNSVGDLCRRCGVLVGMGGRVLGRGVYGGGIVQLHGGTVHLELVKIRASFFLLFFYCHMLVKVINIIIFQSVKAYFSVQNVVWS